MNKHAIIFLAWGEKYINETLHCISHSVGLSKYDLFVITDQETEVPNNTLNVTLNVIRTVFNSSGLLRKTELVDHLPDGYEVFLFLDSDTIVIEDISLGFEKAAQFGIALAQAPHYSLDYFFKFGKVMQSEGIANKGQLQYNTGVIFFRHSAQVMAVFQLWKSLTIKYQATRKNDQPFFSLAMEQLGFNPYTLSISYNYRGYGDAISGLVRIWHSHGPVPKDINKFNLVWPPRKAKPGKVIHPSDQPEEGI